MSGSTASDDTEESDAEGFRLGLRAQLVVFMALFSLGPLIITNYVGYSTSWREQRRLSIWSIQNAARLATLETELFTREKRNLVSSLIAGNRDLRRPSAKALLRGEAPPGKGGPLDDHLRAKAREADEAVAFYVLSPEGRLLGASSRERLGSGWMPSERCVSTSGREARVSIVEGESGPLLLIREPFGVSESGDRAVLCGVFDFEVRDKLRVFASMMWSGGRFRLGRPGGRVVVETQPAGAGGDGSPRKRAITLHPPGVFPSSSAFRAQGDRPPAEAAPPGGGGIVTGSHTFSDSLLGHLQDSPYWAGKYDAPDGESYYAATSPVRATPWVVVADVPESAVLASLEGLRNGALFGGMLFSLIVLAGIGYTVRRFVGPISELLEAIRRMKRGELDQSVEQRGPTEIAALTRHFNAMSSRVAELQGNLEQRVEDRTERLQRSRAFNELLIDSIDDNLVVIDQQRRITKANAAALGTYGEAIVEQKYHRVFEHRGEPTPESPVEESLESGEAASAERVHRYDGRPEIMEVQTFPLPGGEAALLVMTRRVSEQKRRQAQMIHSEKMAAYGLLAAGIAHEIGNPLSSIKAQLPRARMVDDDVSVDETLEIVESEVDRIEKLLRQIVGVARRQETKQRLMSVNQVVQDAVQLLRHDPGSRKVEFDLSLDESIPPIRGDEDRILQVLLNLGINASDAIEGRGEVRIRTDCVDGEVRIRVSDTGPGVPEEIQGRIFEPHFTTKPAGKGTGLGLFVTSRIVEELSGRIRYLDDASEGATFEVLVPAAE